MPNHYHLDLASGGRWRDGTLHEVDGGTHTMRYNFHYEKVGQGHVYQQRFKSFPIQDDSHFYVACTLCRA